MSERATNVVVAIEIAIAITILAILGSRGPSLFLVPPADQVGAQRNADSGTSPVVVPDLRGTTALTAYERLLERGLEIGNVRPIEGPAGHIVRSDPAAGVSVVSGTRIDIYVGVQPTRLRSHVSQVWPR